jgi:hypothetical protein
MSVHTTLTRAQVLGELNALGLAPDGDQIPNVQAVIFDHGYLVHTLIPEWRYFLRVMKFDLYLPNSRVCKQFAGRFVTFGNDALWKLLAETGEDPGQILTGVIVTEEEFSFGGVPAGGAHELNMLRSSLGWFAFEPQTDALAPWGEYPNRNCIRLSYPRF